MRKFSEKNYRPCVGIVLINNGSIFAGQRLDYKSDAWQMPQGGIEENESPIRAATVSYTHLLAHETPEHRVSRGGAHKKR